jgi:hypothetical protein
MSQANAVNASKLSNYFVLKASDVRTSKLNSYFVLNVNSALVAKMNCYVILRAVMQASKLNLYYIVTGSPGGAACLLIGP